jgi:prevent-host-death family protein
VAADTVGSYEAKTHLPELLRRVESGESITITKHGKPVARLVPPGSAPLHPDAATTIAAMLRFRQERGPSLGGLPLRELIETGRRR